ncbi:MAG TPA: hypothetical protein VK791_00610 [bacterium]|jgi:hypothetical protein|nr:hypothetical protein [bacterium]
MKKLVKMLMMFAAVLMISNLVSAQPVNHATWDLQVKPSSVPDSCNWQVFEAVLKITNVWTSPLDLHTVEAEYYFDAGQNEIQAVHPTGTYAVIYNAQGTQLGFIDANNNQRLTNISGAYAPDRLANQSWVTWFSYDPQSPTSIVPPGGCAIVTVTLQRANGASPFDQGCKNFTRIDPGTPQVFAGNKFFTLNFLQTQIRICEALNLTTIDPQTGISPLAPYISDCNAENGPQSAPVVVPTATPVPAPPTATPVPTKAPAPLSVKGHK